MQRLAIVVGTIVTIVGLQPALAQIGQGATTDNGYPIGQGATSDRYPGGNNGYPGGGYPGGGYPGGGPGYGPQTITCTSRNYQQMRCPTNTRGDVRLIQQLSDSRCKLGKSWGYDRRGIWVTNGCSARFAVGGGGGGGYPGGGYPGGGYPAGPRTITCSSIKYAPARCAVDVYRGARLVQDISGSCNARNWGWDRGGVWVNNGCRGRFEVR